MAAVTDALEFLAVLLWAMKYCTWGVVWGKCQYHGCWCGGSLCHQVINSHGIDYEKWAGAFLKFETGFQLPVPLKCAYMNTWISMSAVRERLWDFNHLLPTAMWRIYKIGYIDGLVQDCSFSIANAQEILQSFTKPLIYLYFFKMISTCKELKG